MESSTTDSMCRCCAAEGIFKDIKTSYHWMGEEEVYGDMLRECFDVKLASIEEGGICEVCITQLRNAANFKKQVLHTEKKFKRHLDSQRFKPTEVKEELSGDNDNSSDDDRGAADSEEDEDYVPEFEIPIKTETPEESKSRKRAAKASTSRAKKSRATDDEDKSLASKSRGRKITVSNSSKKSTNKSTDIKKTDDTIKTKKTSRDDAKESKESNKEVDASVKKISTKTGDSRKNKVTGTDNAINNLEFITEDNVKTIKSNAKTGSVNKSKESRTIKSNAKTASVNKCKESSKEDHVLKGKLTVNTDQSKISTVLKKVDDTKKSKTKSKENSKNDAKYSKEKPIVCDSSQSSKKKQTNRKLEDCEANKSKTTIKTKEGKKTRDSKKVGDDKVSKVKPVIIDLCQSSKKKNNKTLVDGEANKSKTTKKRNDEKTLVIDLSQNNKEIDVLQDLVEKDTVIEIHDDEIPKSSKKKKSKSKNKSRKHEDKTEIQGDNSTSHKKLKAKGKKESIKYANLIDLLAQVPECDNDKTVSKNATVNDDDVIEIPEPRSGRKRKIDIEGFEINTRTQKDDDFYAIQVTEVDKHIHNIRTILMHSNATPIQNHNETGFTCGFCVDQFLTASDLKTHTLENHDDDYIQRFMAGHTMYAYVVKLDITSLRCVICTRKIFTLELLIEHLEIKHDVKFHKDIKNQILPFKFQSDIFSCVICDRKFDRFQQMQWHMSVHYRNFECDHCTAAFINKSTLRTHLNRHKTGIFKCRFCTKVYDTKEKMTVHEKFVHIATHKRNKCTYCDEFFARYIKKMQHMVEVHGHKPRVVKCNACNKTFETKEKLTVHNKRDHMMERNHKCEICGNSFFSNYDLRRHKTSHVDVKPFVCKVCNKGFNRKDNMLEHSRIHTGENIRFSCERCGRNFPHMARLRRHAAMRHKELLVKP